MVLSVTFFKKINFKVFFFLGRKQKSFRLRECKWSFISSTSEGDQGLKATSEMKTRLPFYQVSFLHIHSLSSILVLNSYLRIFWLHNHQWQRESQMSKTSVSYSFNPHLTEGNDRKGFFAQEGVRIPKKEIKEITSWDPTWSIQCDWRASADSEHIICLPI